MIKFALVLIFFSLSLSSFCQVTYLRDSIDKIAVKVLKKKRVKYSKLIDDSTGKTFEYSKRGGHLRLACLKSNRDSVTTELHFVYSGSSLLKVSCKKMYWRKREVTYDTYYFMNNQFLSSFPDDDVDTRFVDYLLKTSNELYAEAIESIPSKD